MIKCFLSHSSSDKSSYVRSVKDEIRKEATIYDEDTFEKGMMPIEEIIEGLNNSSLFVIFISDESLSSDWVLLELDKAKEHLDKSTLARIYPIIIDEKITFEDSRIPAWMKEHFNVQHIRQPKIAARKINQRLREIILSVHPKIKEREGIFVGRNDKINEIEERFDDYEKPTPVVVITSGLPSIGKKSFIKHSLIKTNIIKHSFDFPVFSLSEAESIEDFILRFSDLGLTERYAVLDLLSLSQDEKIDLAISLVKTAAGERERILIEDSGAIVKFDGSIAPWFEKIYASLHALDFLTICVVSRFRAARKYMHANELIYITEIAELEIKERNGLFNRYRKFRELSLSDDEMQFFTSLLSGYPEQVLFAVDMIADTSVFEAKKISHEIRIYSDDKAKVILKLIETDQDKLDFLHLLSKFDFISFKVLFQLLDETTYFPLLVEFINSSICERLGSSGDYVRVNEVIKDYVSRNRYNIKNKFQEVLDKHVIDFINNQEQLINDSNGDIDVSDQMFSIQEALKKGYEVNSALLIPSYFVKTIRSLYLEKQYNESIKLAQRILHRSEFMDEDIVNAIRYTQCQCLARLKKREFFAEVRNISEPDSSFLHGFFYRLSGQQDQAIESFNRVLSRRPNDQRAKAELVLIYMQNEQPDLAFSLAKENYLKWKNNPINANNYFACLLHKQPKTDKSRSELLEVIGNLKLDLSPRTQEMSLSNEAKFKAYYDNDETSAFDIVDDLIATFPTVTYPLLTKADIAIHFNNKQKLQEALSNLESLIATRDPANNTFNRFKAIWLSMTGRKGEAKELVRNKLKGVNKNSLTKLFDKIDSY
jgi:tetratricopeptide (TPR) repeat protein